MDTQHGGSEDPSSTSPSDAVQENPPKQPQNAVIFVNPKCLGHLLSLSPQSSPSPNLKAGEARTSSSIPELCNSAHQNTGACISRYHLYRVGQHLLDCWSTPLKAESRLHSWYDWQVPAGNPDSSQPVACWWRLRDVWDQPPQHHLQHFQESQHALVLPFASCGKVKLKNWVPRCSLHVYEPRFHRGWGWLEVTSHLNKVGHLQLVFHVILLLEVNNLKLRFKWIAITVQDSPATVRLFW